MLSIRAATLAAFVGLALIPALARADDYTLVPITIGQPWARATPPSAQAGGGYLALTNNGAVVDRLIAARSPAAELVQIHEMKMEGDIMRMRELENGLDVPAGGTVTLAPGGYHLMLTGLKAPLAKDSRVPVTLVFEKAGSIDVELAVGAIGSARPAQNH